MNIIESLNKGLEEKYHLNEAKEDKERFKSFVNDDALYNRFELLKSKQIIKGQDADYTYWEKQSINALRDFVEKTEAKQEEKNKKRTATKQHYRQISDLTEGEDYNFVYSGNGWTIYEILTHKASQWFGRNTQWCITMKDDDSYFIEYKDGGANFYFLIPDENPENNKWCYAYYGEKQGYLYNEFNERKSTFWDAEDTSYPFEDSYALMDLNILSSVLVHLPGISQKDINKLDTITANIEDVKNNGYVYNPQDEYIYIRRLNPTKVVVPEGVERIEDSAFSDCKKLKELQISNSVKEIGREAFGGCDSLQEVILPDGVKKLEDFAFASCSSLQEIIIPNNVEKIEYGGFKNCSSLTKIKLPSNLKEIEACAFQSCSSLISIDIPDGVTKIGKMAFDYCTHLQKVTLPNSLVSIETEAFEYCIWLQNIVIPSNVTKIGMLAFNWTRSLKEIKINGEYRPEMFKDAGLNDNTTLNWIDEDIKETWKDIKNTI